MKKICIVGMGNMGRAIFDLVRSKKLFDIRGVDRGDNLNAVIGEVDYIIIAVKPQNFEELSSDLTVDLSDKVVISIMAGVKMGRVSQMIGSEKIVRCMPNLALKTGKSMTGFICSKEIGGEKEDILLILKSFGEVVEVRNEDDIDKITALSGSGPAYFFYLAETMFKQALDYGFTKKEADKIVRTTFSGSAAYAESEGIDFKELRQRITSKGGTTEAAISYLKECKFAKCVTEAIKKAEIRAKEL